MLRITALVSFVFLIANESTDFAKLSIPFTVQFCLTDNKVLNTECLFFFEKEYSSMRFMQNHLYAKENCS